MRIAISKCAVLTSLAAVLAACGDDGGSGGDAGTDTDTDTDTDADACAVNGCTEPDATQCAADVFQTCAYDSTDDSCDSGGCSNVSTCDDLDSCTIDECRVEGGGGCQFFDMTEWFCGDGDDCTDDSCDAEDGCVHENICDGGV